MADFELKDTNLSGLAVITEPDASWRKLPENFMTKYDYATVYQPDLLKELNFANGKGNITGFLRAVAGGTHKTYASDIVQHGEMSRLMNTIDGVTIANGVATFPKDHQLRVNDVVRFQDGDKEYQATVSEIVSPKVCKLLNDGAGALPTDPVSILCDFSSRFLKGDKGFEQGKKWAPKFYQNHSHIIKDYYEIADSDLAHATWVETPNGPIWMHAEMERFNTLFGNKEELTAIFNKRSLDNSESAQGGFAQGMNGVVPTIEDRGNVSNNFITSDDDLSNLAKRAKVQGICREFTFWCSHDQLKYIRKLAAGLNAAFVNGANYGSFANSKDMALYLDFTTIHIDGVTFHFCAWALLDDPTAKPLTQTVAFVGVPSGNTFATNQGGTTESVPYLDILYRVNGMENRRRKTKGWGVFGTQAKPDASSVELITEFTNRVVGANNFFVGRNEEIYV